MGGPGGAGVIIPQVLLAEDWEAMELFHLRASENISLSMNSLTLGVSGKKAPGLRTEHRFGGLFCFVILICFAVVELVIELLGSSTSAYRHSVVQPKSLWDPVEAEAVLQPCEVSET